MGGLLWPLCLALTPIYAVIVFIRNKKYDLFVEPARFSPRVVSIGNLGVGGTGKTPLGLWLLREALEASLNVAMLLRGYGSKGGVSDEAELYKQVLGAEHVYVNPSRKESLEKAEASKYDLVLMDDAFQHRKVHRDLDIVVMDVQHCLLEDHIMPLGTLRESTSGLKRAKVLVMTRCESLSTQELNEMKQRFQSSFPHLKLIEARTEITGVVALEPDSVWKDSHKVFIFSGIGDPDKFKASVQAQGLKIVGEKVFRDHHFVSREEMQAMIEEAKAKGAEALLTTSKDAVKLSHKSELPIFMLNITFHLSEAEAFFNLVRGEQSS